MSGSNKRTCFGGGGGSYGGGGGGSGDTQGKHSYSAGSGGLQLLLFQIDGNSATLNSNNTHNTINTANSSGDPYITTFSGVKYKLPNQTKIYRMFKKDDLVINASCSPLTTKEFEKVQKAVGKNYKVPQNGYFYDKFYVHYGGKYLIFDRYINVIEKNFELEYNDWNIVAHQKLKPFICPIQKLSYYYPFTMDVNDVQSGFANIYTLKLLTE